MKLDLGAPVDLTRRSLGVSLWDSLLVSLRYSLRGSLRVSLWDSLEEDRR